MHAIWIVVGIVPKWALAGETTLDAVTFYAKPGTMFVNLRPAASALGIEVTWDDENRTVGLGQAQIPAKDFAKLFDGTKLLSLRQLKDLGYAVEYDATTDSAIVRHKDASFVARPGEKRVEVGLREQRLRAWQGQTMVIDTNVSSGRRGHTTPSGEFELGPYRSRMHYSRLYENSPMPYSIQVNGHVFIHGYSSVPRRPASHGCIRMPIYGKNAAKYFYDWADVGTPVSILTDFRSETIARTQKG